MPEEKLFMEHMGHLQGSCLSIMCTAADVPLLTDLKKAIAEVDAHHVRHMQDVKSLESAFATISPNNSKSSCDYPSHARE